MTSPDTKPIRVVIIDDHAVVRSGLRILIERHPGLNVVGEAGDGREALAIVTREQPDIVLLDLDLGGASGLDLIPEILAAASKTRIIILTGVHDPAAHQRAVQLGALGLVLKEKAVEVVIKAIGKVHAGEVWLDRATLGNMLTQMSRVGAVQKNDPETEKLASLTKREREIIALIGEGLKNKQIAARLFISETTVRHHLTSVFDKLSVGDRLELIIYAYRHGLATPPR